MQKIVLKWSDVWLLQSLYICSSESGPLDVERIIQIADGINHAILTFEEFNNGLYRLRESGLISIEGSAYSISPSAKELFHRFSGQSYVTQMGSIAKHLGIESWSSSYNPNALESPELFISKGMFNSAALKYQRRYGL